MKNYLKVGLITLGLLSMFSCEDEKENRMPEAANLSAPANAAIDQETKPTLTWVKSIDPDNDLVTYDVYVSESEDFVAEDLKGDNIDQNTFTLTTALKSHTKYFWKIVTSDGNGAEIDSDVRYFTTMNSVPAISGLEFPLDEATEVEKSINLKWSAADADGDVLKYTVYLAKANTFTDADIVATDITKSECAVTLDGHSKYFWKVIATDTEGANIESDVASFTSMNSLPSKVALTAPIDGFDKVSLSTKIVWAAATDSDSDVISYTIYYGLNKVINESFAYKKNFTETELTLSNLRGNTTYYWKVIAVDSEGGKMSSDIFSFSTINTVPTAGVLNSNINQLVVDDKVNAILNWSASIDPDKIRNSENKLVFEPLVYDIYCSTDATIDVSDLKKADHSALNFTVEGLEFSTRYFAKIVTRDPQGAKAESTVVEFTTRKQPSAITTGTFTDTRDSKIYKTVTIDGKTWLAENFGFIPANMADGDKQCSVYGVNNSEGRDAALAHENYLKYGVMYTADLLDDIAPAGWHVATDDDWQALEKYSGVPESKLAYSGSTYRGETVHKFQAISGGWSNIKTPTDELEFTAKAGGYYSGYHKGLESYTYFWTNTISKVFFGSKMYFYRAMSGSKTGINRRDNKAPNSRMYVRLVKD